MANILAVDDDRDLCTLLKTALERDGHTVETRCTGADVTSSLCRWADCILLDIMMPGEDGFAVCRRIRAQTEAPILFLTARTDEPSVLTGLGIGADDYLVKPFRLAELRARVNAHLRRQNRCRTASDSSSFQITARHEIGRQPFTGAEHICHLTAKSRRNIGCVLTHISFKDICSPNHRHRLDAGGLTKAACRSIGFCVLKS